MCDTCGNDSKLAGTNDPVGAALYTGAPELPRLYFNTIDHASAGY